MNNKENEIIKNAFKLHSKDESKYEQGDAELASALLALPIFIPSGDDEKIIKTPILATRETEIVSYEGIHLSPQRTLPVLNYIYKKASETERSINVYEAKTLGKLAGYKNPSRDSEINKIKSILEGLHKSHLSIKMITNGKREDYLFNLIPFIHYDYDKKLFTVGTPLQFLEDNSIWKQMFSLDFLDKLGSNSNIAKSLYIYYESMRYVKYKKIKVSLKRISERLQSEMKLVDLNKHIKKAHKMLVEIGYLVSADFDGRGENTYFYIERHRPTATEECIEIKAVKPRKALLVEKRKKRISAREANRIMKEENDAIDNILTGEQVEVLKEINRYDDWNNGIITTPVARKLIEKHEHIKDMPF